MKSSKSCYYTSGPPWRSETRRRPIYLHIRPVPLAMCDYELRNPGAQIRDFRVEITDEQTVDLRDRLTRTRWPESETVDDWSQGILPRDLAPDSG